MQVVFFASLIKGDVLMLQSIKEQSMRFKNGGRPGTPKGFNVNSAV